MPRVKIKSRGPATREKKTNLLRILCTREIHITKVQEGNEGYIITLLNEDHADSIFQREIKGELEKDGFIPTMPPELKVKKSVIITRVDDLIFDWGEEDIKEEITTRNSWIGEGIENIYKFPNSPTLKITFSNALLAKRCKEKGLLAFNLSVPPTDIKQETFIPIKCCLKCYSLEDHYTNECPKDQHYKVCSECSVEGHVWHQCREQTKKCINCGDNHSSLAMKCTKRKEIIKEKRKAETERGKWTYSEAAKGTSSTQGMWPVHQAAYTTIKEDSQRINFCIQHAHYRNIENPGTYAEEVNKIMAANNLPTMIIPDMPDSTKIFNLAGEAERRSRSQGRKRSISKKKENIEEMSLYTEISEAEKTETPMEAKDIDLHIYTSKETGWPKKNITAEDLVKGFQHNKYKYTYRDHKYTENQIINMIKNKEITLKECWYVKDNDVFRKIRTGNLADKSPPELRDPRLHKQAKGH